MATKEKRVFLHCSCHEVVMLTRLFEHFRYSVCCPCTRYIFMSFGIHTVSFTEIFLNMAINLLGDFNEFSTQAITIPTTTQTQHNQMDDPTSPSYIPCMARTVPHSTTVHTIFIKKITYPMTSRPDELWILERTTEGMETWRPIETFLENLHLTHDPRALRATANQWRLHYDVPAISPSTPASSLFPVLPHPEHSNVHFGQPVSAVPDHTYILQSCWGRSAQHQSQGSPTSLYWPPWRSTPPSSPAGTTRRTTTQPMTSVPTSYTHGHPQPDHNGVTDMSDSSV